MNYKGRRLLTELEQTNDQKEPALVVGSAVTVVSGVMYLILHFFPGISSDVADVISNILLIVFPLVTAYFIRGKVWSPNSVSAAVDEAVSREVMTKNSPASNKLRDSPKYRTNDETTEL